MLIVHEENGAVQYLPNWLQNKHVDIKRFFILWYWVNPFYKYILCIYSLLYSVLIAYFTYNLKKFKVFWLIV